MRVLLSLWLILLGTVAASAADLTFVRVWPGYRTSESFDRISEYFTGQENPPAQTVLRTHPNARAGYYFLVRLKNGGAEVTGAKLDLQIVAPDSPETKSYSFVCLLPSGTTVYNIGLTGPDWPDDPKVNVVAWQLRVLSPDGAELGKTQSYLWGKASGK